MKKALSELLDIIKKEAKYLGIAAAALMIILKIAFYNEDISSAAVKGAALSLIFIMPGWILGLRWHDKFGFTERITIGTLFAMMITGIFSYYLGIIGVNVSYHMYILPALLCCLGIGLFLLKKSDTKSKEHEQKS